MNQNQTQNLKIGDKVRIISDKGLLCEYGVPTSQAGQIVTITKVNIGNDGFYFIHTDESMYCLNSRHIAEIISKISTKFDKHAVETIRKEGGNAAITTQINIRINAARTELSTCTGAAFDKQIKSVERNLREAKMLHRSLAK